MITVTINNTKIELFSGIKEMPITRFKIFQNYILQDSGIGNTIEDIDKHLSNTIMFLSNDKKEEAKEELVNTRYSFFSMINGISYKTKSFACLVSKIDAETYNDLSTEGLDAVVKKIESLGIATEEVLTHWENVKKNLIPS
jgi:hypothetical protein